MSQKCVNVIVTLKNWFSLKQIYLISSLPILTSGSLLKHLSRLKIDIMPIKDIKESTIKILNRSTRWIPSRPKYMKVQKPYTEEWCRQRKNDWFFRCYMDFINLKDKGWTFWFPTLTYNNDNLPKLHINEFIECLPLCSPEPNCNDWIDIPDSENAPCFSHEHVTLFTKELRIYLHRSGYETKGLKYLVCSEFGEKYRRPHYHAFIAVPDVIDSDTMLDILRRTWHYGFVGVSRLGLKVDSAYGIRYATKYVVKDLSYMSIKFPSGRTLSEYMRKQNNYSYKEIKKLLSPFMPKLYCSKGIGSSYLDYLYGLPENDLIDFCCGYKKVNLPLGDGLDFNLPRYYVNKMCYCVDVDLSNYYGHVVMYLTAFGIEVEKRRFRDKVENVYTKLLDLDFNVCSGLGLLSEYYSINKVDRLDFAWYYGYLRYHVSDNPDVSVHYIMANRQMMFNDMVHNRYNVYLCDFLFYHGLVDTDWLAENSACCLYSLPLMCEKNPHPSVRRPTLSSLPQFADFEHAAKAYDRILDCIFDKNEVKKYNKRLQLETDKFECLRNNPSLFTNYESIKDFEVLDECSSVSS